MQIFIFFNGFFKSHHFSFIKDSIHILILCKVSKHLPINIISYYMLLAPSLSCWWIKILLLYMLKRIYTKYAYTISIFFLQLIPGGIFASFHTTELLLLLLPLYECCCYCLRFEALEIDFDRNKMIHVRMIIVRNSRDEY